MASRYNESCISDMPGLSECVFGLTLVEQSKSKSDQMKGLAIIESSMDRSSKVFGPAYIIMLGAVSVRAYLSSGLYDAALQVVVGWDLI